MGFVINLWIFFWLIGSEVIVSQHHQLSGSCQSGGLYACGRHTVNFFQLVEVSVLQNSSEEEALDFTCSLRGETKGPWLCLMAKLLLLCLLECFSFCIFSLLWLNLFFGTWGRPTRLKFNYRRKPGRGHRWSLFWGGPMEFRSCIQRLQIEMKQFILRILWNTSMTSFGQHYKGW